MSILWNNPIIKNKNNQVRSGWIILVIMACYYGITFLAITAAITAIKQYYILTGDIVPATGYLSPRIDWVKAFLLPAIIQLLTEVFMFGVPVVSWIWIQRHKISKLGLTPLSSGKKDGIVGMLLGFVCCTVVFLIVITVGGGEVDWTPHISMEAGIWVLLFVLVALAEETMNRGFFMANLRRSKNLVLIFIVPSVIFGMLHLANPGVTLFSVLNIILVGIVFSYMFLKSGNIWMCIGYHFTWNTFQGIIYGMPVSGLNAPGIITTHFKEDNLLNGGKFGIEGGVLTTVVSLLALVFVWFYYRNSKYDFINDAMIDETAAGQ